MNEDVKANCEEGFCEECGSKLCPNCGKCCKCGKCDCQRCHPAEEENMPATKENFRPVTGEPETGIPTNYA